MTEAEPELPYTLDPQTLREVFADPAAVSARIASSREIIRSASDEIAELIARGELVTLLTAQDELDEALDEARAAVDRAEIAGTPAQQHTARLRLAQVFTVRGDFGESNVEITELLAAVRQFGPVIEAFTHHHAGLNDYAQGHFDDARGHFARALQIRDELELPDGERAASRVALAAANRHLPDHGADA